MKERDSLNINRPIISPGTLLLMGATDIVPSTTWSTLTDGTTTIRKLVRDGYYVVDKTLTPLGFGIGSIENTDWENVKATEIPLTSILADNIDITADSIDILADNSN
jgi:hypothetical protein